MKRQLQEVAEFQGFYGPFTVTERLLQKIWLRGDFNVGAARALDGRHIEVLFPGKWNLLEGPDFKEARIRIGGRELAGDVELHFRVADWRKHRHHLDPAYDRVVLHVLLFPSSPDEPPAMTASGEHIPALALLDLLYHDLEEYAAEDAIESTLERSHWQATEELLSLPLEARRDLLARHAKTRWMQKVNFARLRLERLGWEAACHHTALEILGYRRNRGAMLNLATRHPLAAWRSGLPDEELVASCGRWITQGTRPANHPKERVRQYRQMVEARPEWPKMLREELRIAASVTGEWDEPATGPFRAKWNLKALRDRLANGVAGDAIGGSRLDTLCCDGFFPLAAAGCGHGDLFPLWFIWYAGDFPERVLHTLRTAGIADHRRFAFCNGFCQGVFSLSLEKRSDPLVCFDAAGER